MVCDVRWCHVTVDLDGLGEEGDLRQAWPRGGGVQAPLQRKHYAHRGKQAQALFRSAESTALLVVQRGRLIQSGVNDESEKYSLIQRLGVVRASKYGLHL